MASFQLQDDELPLADEPLHWGMFLPAAFLCCALALATLPWVFIFNVGMNTLRPLAAMAGTQPPNYIWLFLVPEILLISFFLGITCVAYATSRIVLTDKRLHFRTGLLSKQSGEIPVQSIEGIFVSEPILGRIVGYGTIAVTTTGGRTFPLPYLRNPVEFKRILEDARKRAENSAPRQSIPSPEPDDVRYMPKH